MRMRMILGVRALLRSSQLVRCLRLAWHAQADPADTHVCTYAHMHEHMHMPAPFLCVAASMGTLKPQQCLWHPHGPAWRWPLAQSVQPSSSSLPLAWVCGPQEFAGWAAEAGFSGVRCTHLMGSAYACVALK